MYLILSYRKIVLRIISFSLCLLIASCHFHLRGEVNLPFSTIYVDLPDTSVLGNELKRSLRSLGNIRVLEQRTDAELLLVNVVESKVKDTLSISSTGRPREFRLRYSLKYRVIDRQGKVLAETIELWVEQIYSFNDSAPLAKEVEEVLLYRDMQRDLVHQVLRHLSNVKPSPASSLPTPQEK